MTAFFKKITNLNPNLTTQSQHNGLVYDYLSKIYDSIMVTTLAKIGRADAKKVMMYENFNSRGPFFKNGHL
jgi:hypothetical protein